MIKIEEKDLYAGARIRAVKKMGEAEENRRNLIKSYGEEHPAVKRWEEKSCYWGALIEEINHREERARRNRGLNNEERIKKAVLDFISLFAEKEDLDGHWWGHDTDLGDMEEEIAAFIIRMKELL